MSQTYFAILTAVGEAKLANAAALGTTVQITQMAVGDGNGDTPIPVRTQTALVREKRRAPLNALSIDPVNASQIIAEQVIPESVGGWWIRELGLYDVAGDLVAVANCAPTYKPQLAEGSGRTQVIRMVLIVSATTTVELKIDPSVVLATRAYVDSQDALHVAAADPHPQYAPKASPAFTGTPTAPTPAAGDNSTKLSTTAFVKAAINALINASPAALDTLQELAAALGNDANFAATVTNALALKAPLASPVLTGDPKAPTAAQFDNDTSIATTAFVQRALGSFQRAEVIGGATSLTALDVGKAFSMNAGSSAVLPLFSNVQSGAAFYFLNADATPKTIARQGADLIYGLQGGAFSSALTSVTLAPGDWVIVSATSAQWEVFAGSSLNSHSSGQFGAALAASGYQKLPSGLIVQWGLAGSALNTGGNVTVTLPVAFPNACLRALAFYDSADTTVASGFTCHRLSTSQIKINCYQGSSSTPSYIAIGY